jgi:hypothetical protein
MSGVPTPMLMAAHEGDSGRLACLVLVATRLFQRARCYACERMEGLIDPSFMATVMTLWVSINSCSNPVAPTILLASLFCGSFSGLTGLTAKLSFRYL